MQQTLNGRGRYSVLHPRLSHRRAGRRGGSPPELRGLDAHATLRAARHVAHRHRGRPRHSSPDGNVADRTPGPAVGHGRLRTRRVPPSPPPADLAKLATALLDGTAPGMSALKPTTATDQSNTRIGDFWTRLHLGRTGQTITWPTPDRPAATPPTSASTARATRPSSSCPTSPTTPTTWASSSSSIAGSSSLAAEGAPALGRCNGSPARSSAGYEMLICPPSRRCAGASFRRLRASTNSFSTY